MLITNSVLLLKSQTPQNGEDQYEAILKASNFEVRQVKTLVFKFKNIDVLRDKLKNNTDYSGLILSSPRCLEAVRMALEGNDYLGSWKTKHNFVVGETTHKAALEKLDLNCLGKDSGNAVNLSKIIKENKSQYIKPFLFPHGNLKTDTLKREFGKDGIQIEGVEVYDTISNPDIEHDLAKATDDFKSMSEYVVFFSPSGVSACIELILRIPVEFAKVKFIAIGPVTEMAITERNFPVYGVANRPNPNEVLNAVLRK